MQSPISAVLMRGGTSRALVFLSSSLPDDVADQDRILLAAMGSPDPHRHQVHGVGGATSSTSKVAIVAPSARQGADVDYTFAQVDVERPLVDRRGNCGNISSAIGPFAIDQGLVRSTGSITPVRILNTNTNKVIVAHVPVGRDGCFEPEGDFAIAGVPGTASRILLEFLDPGGAVTGKLLPTGHEQDLLDVGDGITLSASIVDAGNPVVFVRFEDAGLTAETSSDEIDSNIALLSRIERIRAAAAVAAGLAPTMEEATANVPSVPKIAFIAPPHRAHHNDGGKGPRSQCDLIVKSMSMGRTHGSFQLTAAICTAVAAAIPGTLVAQASAAPVVGAGNLTIRIGHPSGVMEISSRVARSPTGWHAIAGSATRTARRLMDGRIYLPSSVVAKR